MVRLGVLVLAALTHWACAGPAAFPASMQPPAPPCPRSEVHRLVAQGRLYSALRLARSEPLAAARVRGAEPASARGVCTDREQRASLIGFVLAELGACDEARRTSSEPFGCRPETLPVGEALARARDLRRSGQPDAAARLSARALRAAAAAGSSVRAIPMLPDPIGSAPHELRKLEDVLGDHWERWQVEPPVYFLGGSPCVGGACLLAGGSMVKMPGAEFLAGFAPRRFDYPWRMYPARGLTASAEGIVEVEAQRTIPLGVPAGVVAEHFTGARFADVAFNGDGSLVWVLAESGRLFAADTATGGLLADFDLATTCPRVDEPFAIVSAPSAELAIARIGTAPGCATLIHTTDRTTSELPFAAGSLLALSGDGRIAAVHHQGRITSYALEALQWLDPPEPASFSAPEVSQLALSYDGSVIAAVVPGKQVELPDGRLEIWATELRLWRPNGVPLPGYEPRLIGFAWTLLDGDWGGRVFSLRNVVFDYEGRLRAVLIARNASVLAAFADGTVEGFGPAPRQLYRCAIDAARFPAEDCADAFERSGQLESLVQEPPIVPQRPRRAFRW